MSKSTEYVRAFRQRQRLAQAKEPNWKDLEGRLSVVDVWLGAGHTVPPPFASVIHTLADKLGLIPAAVETPPQPQPQPRPTPKAQAPDATKKRDKAERDKQRRAERLQKALEAASAALQGATLAGQLEAWQGFTKEVQTALKRKRLVTDALYGAVARYDDLRESRLREYRILEEALLKDERRNGLPAVFKRLFDKSIAAVNALYDDDEMDNVLKRCKSLQQQHHPDKTTAPESMRYFHIATKTLDFLRAKRAALHSGNAMAEWTVLQTALEEGNGQSFIDVLRQRKAALEAQMAARYGKDWRTPFAEAAQA